MRYQMRDHDATRAPEPSQVSACGASAHGWVISQPSAQRTARSQPAGLSLSLCQTALNPECMHCTTTDETRTGLYRKKTSHIMAKNRRAEPFLAVVYMYEEKRTLNGCSLPPCGSAPQIPATHLEALIFVAGECTARSRAEASGYGAERAHATPPSRCLVCIVACLAPTNDTLTPNNRREQ